MKILWFTWKDRKNPRSGGAEVVNEELAKRLVRNAKPRTEFDGSDSGTGGHEVIFVTAGYPECLHEEMINGYKIIRVGNRYTVYWQAYKYYKKHRQDWPDLVIDEINTVPFFASLYVRTFPPSHVRTILFIHQLARQIWFYEMLFPLSLVGYWLEPLYLRLLSSNVFTFKNSNATQVITVSESTKKDLTKYGFKPKNIHVISEGINVPLLTKQGLGEVKKDDQPTILSLGAIKPMKRTHHIIKAFEFLYPLLTKEGVGGGPRLIIAGSPEGHYGRKVLKMIEQSPFKDDIQYLGQVTAEKKTELLQRSHVLVVTSVKEGWGLVVTEAASQGTPAVVYDVDGLRDSVRHHQTGLVTEENTPENLAKNILKLLADKELYERLRENAWQRSKTINFEQSYEDFKKALSWPV
jgi:glycosyltransferase involved in cell wall biosynthesis